MKIDDKGFKGHKHVIDGPPRKVLGKSLQADAIRLLQPVGGPPAEPQGVSSVLESSEPDGEVRTVVSPRPTIENIVHVQPLRRDGAKKTAVDFSSSFQGPLPKMDVEDSVLYESEIPILTQSKQIKDIVSPRTTVGSKQVAVRTEKDKIRDARQAMAAHESERYSENQSKQERSLSRKSLKL